MAMGKKGGGRADHRAQQVAQYVWLRYSVQDQEVVGVLLVDARCRLIAERAVYRGTFNRTAVEPREILKEALLRGAAGVIVFHTRPSGDPTPGVEDRAFLRRMCGRRVVGVEVIDHLIIGGTQSWRLSGSGNGISGARWLDHSGPTLGTHHLPHQRGP